MMDKEKLIEIVKRFHEKTVLVIGDLMLDKYIWGRVNRISPEAPVQVVNVKKESFAAGGSANVAMNLSALGGKTDVVGVVGKDESNKQLISMLNEKKIKTEGVIIDDKKPTTQKIRIIGQNQQLLRVDYEDREYLNKDDENRVMKYIKKIIKDIDIIIISDYAKGSITESFMNELKTAANEHDKKIIVDPKPKHTAFYEGVYLVTPNNNEACEMAGIEKNNHCLEDVGKELGAKMNTNILITRGEKGMTLIENNNVTNIPTKAKEVYDVTGAGDTVVAALALSIASGATPEQAAVIANHAAGIAVGKVGTTTVGSDELMESLEEE